MKKLTGRQRWKISIHALREEGDFLGQRILQRFVLFLSTPSARRATSQMLCQLS